DGGRLHPAADKVGPGPPRRFRPPLRQFRAARGDRRGPARGTQSRHARSAARGLPWHRRSQGVLHAVGELGADDRARGRERREGDARRGRPYRDVDAPVARRRLASDGHRPDGRRPETLGGRSQRPGARRRQPVHRRRQRSGDRRRGQSNPDDPGGGASHRRSHTRRPRRPEVGMTAARSLTDAERAVLRAVMDRLVPPIDDLPGAGAMGLLDAVETMARAHPPFHLALLALLGGLPAATFAGLAGPIRTRRSPASRRPIRRSSTRRWKWSTSPTTATPGSTAGSAGAAGPCNRTALPCRRSTRRSSKSPASANPSGVAFRSEPGKAFRFTALTESGSGKRTRRPATVGVSAKALASIITI